MTPFDSFHLPALPAGHPMELMTAGRLKCRFPAPTAELIEQTVEALREARRTLGRRPVDDVVEAVDRAAVRLADPGDPLRQEAEDGVGRATGYSPAMTRLVLDRMTADWRAPALRRLLRAELGDPAALDRFLPREGDRRTRAYGPGLSFHVFAGNVPGVAVTSIVRSLLVKAPVLAKLASGEPVLPVLFARALTAADPGLGAAVATTYWPGGTPEPERVALDAADLVVVYGGEEAVASVRARAAFGSRLVVHGPRLSAGLIAAGALEGDPATLARDVARAVATFDQQGCVSPHAIWIEDPAGDLTDRFADALAVAMDEVERVLPRGRLDAAATSTIHQERGAAELRGHATGTTRVLTGDGTSWTVVVDRAPGFRPSCLNRFVYLRPVARVDDAVEALAGTAAYLQSVAIAAPAELWGDVAHRLAMAGATRVTTFDRLPWPPPEWHHDGSGPLQELVRWVDLED